MTSAVDVVVVNGIVVDASVRGMWVAIVHVANSGTESISPGVAAARNEGPVDDECHVEDEGQIDEQVHSWSINSNAEIALNS